MKETRTPDWSVEVQETVLQSVLSVVRSDMRAAAEKDIRNLIACVKGQSSEMTPCWLPVSQRPPRGDLYVVRDSDGQYGFALWEGEWKHTPDQDCGDVTEWYPLPRAK